MRRYHFTIPVKFPGLNDYVRACRANRYEGAKMKRDAERAVIIAARRLPEIDGPVKVYFTWHEGDRRRDLDNVAFAKKFILDGLVKAGKLADDNLRHVVGLEDSFRYTPKDWRVEVVIVEED